MNNQPDTREPVQGGEWEAELIALVEERCKNPSNGSRHEQAIVDFISRHLTAARQAGREEGKREKLGDILIRDSVFAAGRTAALQSVLEKVEGMKNLPYSHEGDLTDARAKGYNTALTAVKDFIINMQKGK